MEKNKNDNLKNSSYTHTYSDGEYGIYLNSVSFPPRGSFLNIPDNVTLGNNQKAAESAVKDKVDTIGSDLYIRY